VNSFNNISKKCTVWQLPDEIEMTIVADDLSYHALKRLYDLPAENIIT